MILKNYVRFSFWVVLSNLCSFLVCVWAQENKTITRKGKGGGGGGGGAGGEGGTFNSTEIQAMLEEHMHVPLQPYVTVSKPLVFEGVDYEHFKEHGANMKMYNDHYDCYYWYTKCVRDMTYFHTVCFYDGSYTWSNYVNQCYADLDKCKYRIRVEWWKSSQGVYGEGGVDYYASSYSKWYAGDGWDCGYFFRRQGYNVLDDRINFYYEDEQAKEVLI